LGQNEIPLNNNNWSKKVGEKKKKILTVGSGAACDFSFPTKIKIKLLIPLA
jgi:hypothetical protein